MMFPRRKRQAPNNRRNRHGQALILVLLVAAVTSLISVQILKSASLHKATIKNSMDMDTAKYQAEAGEQHAMALLKSNRNWSGKSGIFRNAQNASYSFEVQQLASKIEIRSWGSFNGITKTKTVFVTP